MIKRFFKWVDEQCRASRNDYGLEPARENYIDVENCDHLTFKVYRASGGWVVQVKKYDEKDDSMIQQLHVIQHDADFGEALAKIVTFEMI